MILIELPNIPIPWAPSRITNKGAFSPRAKEKNFTRWQIKSIYRNDPIAGYVVLNFLFIFPIPNSASKAEKEAMLSGEIIPTKSDCTNLQKFSEDCLKGIVITDDRNVAKISSEKIYGEKEKVVIKIWEYHEYNACLNRRNRRESLSRHPVV